jgi:hypothetical protein
MKKMFIVTLLFTALASVAAQANDEVFDAQASPSCGGSPCNPTINLRAGHYTVTYGDKTFYDQWISPSFDCYGRLVSAKVDFRYANAGGVVMNCSGSICSGNTSGNTYKLVINREDQYSFGKGDSTSAEFTWISNQ